MCALVRRKYVRNVVLLKATKRLSGTSNVKKYESELGGKRKRTESEKSRSIEVSGDGWGREESSVEGGREMNIYLIRYNLHRLDMAIKGLHKQ